MSDLVSVLEQAGLTGRGGAGFRSLANSPWHDSTVRN